MTGDFVVKVLSGAAVSASDDLEALELWFDVSGAERWYFRVSDDWGKPVRIGPYASPMKALNARDDHVGLVLDFRGSRPINLA